ncbi:hypothetical protein CAPN002_26490 [Capnocytophaga stomatis]|uniref:DUF4280 domain-containing protein n=1 Tax=Capnocytophaga stomatis TaxID=1848904 RepID=UPI00194E3E28|nr:DUF4280 domain-containing protein [Capnocytophaga stomatis]GIJ95431.1 hypothetical protein CAPN002_26490 [Capnocytophaga stomatis]
MANKYVSEGAELRCNSGSKTSKLQVTSQNKVKLEGKYQATEKDKTLMGNFGSCSLCNGNTCVPSLQKWKITSNKPTTFQAPLLLENSYIQCSVGGIIEITNPNQKTLKEGGGDDELDKYYPVLKGDVIFVNGYHSNPLENWEQTLYNAILDKVHEEGEGLQGESVNEHNHTDANDMFTNRELRDVLPENARQDKIEQELKRQNPTKKRYLQKIETIVKSTEFVQTFPDYWNPIVFPKIKEFVLKKIQNLEKEKLAFNNKLEKFWNYWNDLSNKYKGSQKYCEAFNSVGRDHYINGSHGLASSAAHRIDHGIALGYKWASENWQVYPKKMIKSDAPMSKLSFTPTYRPITVVGHSQGAAMGTGVALGIMYYAKEIGWDKIALNVIYLGVNQPQGLHGEEYENLIHDKKNVYDLDAIMINWGEKEQEGKLLDVIAQLFSPRYGKLHKKRGIYEHLKAILADWEAYKSRCVQFTFSNDRGDMVIRDGDIPEIKSACDPDRNTDVFHLHYAGRTVSAKNDKGSPKMKHKQLGYGGGFMKWYDYMANRRFNTLEKDEKPPKDAPKDYQPKKRGDIEEWGDYNSVATACMMAFDKYVRNKVAYERLYGRFDIASMLKKTRETAADLATVGWDIVGEVFSVREQTAYEKLLGVLLPGVYVGKKAGKVIHNKIERTSAWKEQVKSFVITYTYYIEYLRRYASLDSAQLYAHFAPVAYINYEEMLTDFPNAPKGTDAKKETIFDRINKAGEDIFYKIDEQKVSKDSNGKVYKTFNERKNAYKKAVKNLEKRMLSTSIIDTPYIHNVIKAYVKNDKEAFKKLYKEPKYVSPKQKRNEKK